jgi:hypothetical protein
MVVLVVLGLTLLFGVSRFTKSCDEEEAGHTVASTVAPPTSPPSANLVSFTIAEEGTTAIDMPARLEHITAETTAAKGELQIDFLNLASSRCEVMVDLSTLKTHTFSQADKDTAQTRHALGWLEIGKMASPEAIEKYRWATFALRSIDGLSASDLTKIAAEETEHGEERLVTLTVHGDLSLHGHKMSTDAVLEIRFHYPGGAAPSSQPSSLDVTSKIPLHIALSDYDVRPPGPVGRLFIEHGADAIGAKVAATADVTLALHATLNSAR